MDDGIVSDRCQSLAAGFAGFDVSSNGIDDPSVPPAESEVGQLLLSRMLCGLLSHSELTP